MDFSLWKDLVYYDENSPSGLRWKIDIYTGVNYSTKRISSGDIAGTLDNECYWRVWRLGKRCGAHNIIWFLFNGEKPTDLIVDHIDGKADNNLIDNLRLVGYTHNAQNLQMFVTNKSGVTGVRKFYPSGRSKRVYWQATWRKDGKGKSKSFPICVHGEEEAFRLACEYRRKMIAELNEQGAGYTERHGT